MEKVIFIVYSRFPEKNFCQTFGIAFANVQVGDLVKGFRDFNIVADIKVVERKIDFQKQALIVTCKPIDEIF